MDLFWFHLRLATFLLLKPSTETRTNPLIMVFLFQEIIWLTAPATMFLMMNKSHLLGAERTTRETGLVILKNTLSLLFLIRIINKKYHYTHKMTVEFIGLGYQRRPCRPLGAMFLQQVCFWDPSRKLF